MLDFENITGFDWDDGNKNKNEDKHGITTKESEEVFKNEPFILSGNPNNKEIRYMALGESDSAKLLVVVFTIRKDKIRIISARPQSKKERSFYYAKYKQE
jgi:uncharacterized DUF497 family protein